MESSEEKSDVADKKDQTGVTFNGKKYVYEDKNGEKFEWNAEKNTWEKEKTSIVF